MARGYPWCLCDSGWNADREDFAIKSWICGVVNNKGGGVEEGKPFQVLTRTATQMSILLLWWASHYSKNCLRTTLKSFLCGCPNLFNAICFKLGSTWRALGLSWVKKVKGIRQWDLRWCIWMIIRIVLTNPFTVHNYNHLFLNHIQIKYLSAVIRPQNNHYLSGYTPSMYLGISWMGLCNQSLARNDGGTRTA